MSDMTKDIFAAFPFGKLALQRFAPVHENFRLYEAGWLANREVMQVKGAEFRKAKSGPNKGKLSILVKGTEKECFLNRFDIVDFDKPRLEEENE